MSAPMPPAPWLLRLAELAENFSRPATARPMDHPLLAWRRRTVRRLIQQGPLSQERAPTAVPEYTPAEVARRGLAALTEGFRRPVVVRGFYADLSAVRRWSLDYLCDVVGDAVVPVIDQGSGAEGSYAANLLALPFSEAVRRLGTEPLYINNVSGIFLQSRQLEADLDLDAVTARLEPGRKQDRVAATGIFLGGPAVGSPLHCAPAGNAFANIRGRKKWTLIHPALGPYLLPLWSRRLPLAFSGTHFSTENPEHDLLAHLPRETTVLEPGDLLYNGPWWWHDVRNLDALTIGCAVRHRAGHFPLRDATVANHPLYTAMSIYPWTILARSLYELGRRLTGRGGALRRVVNRQLDRKILTNIDAVSETKPTGETP